MPITIIIDNNIFKQRVIVCFYRTADKILESRKCIFNFTNSV